MADLYPSGVFEVKAWQRLVAGFMNLISKVLMGSPIIVLIPDIITLNILNQVNSYKGVCMCVSVCVCV